MSATDCTGYNRNISDGTEYWCHSAPTVTVIAGCIHEHVYQRPMCDYHAAEIRTGAMECGDCLDATPPHICYLEAAR